MSGCPDPRAVWFCFFINQTIQPGPGRCDVGRNPYRGVESASRSQPAPSGDDARTTPSSERAAMEPSTTKRWHPLGTGVMAIPPDEFAEYRLLRPLGESSDSRVYLARDTLLDRLVALKFVNADDSA